MSELQNQLPKWLRKTQHNSWEPEIFISGIVLFGLFQIPSLLEKFRYYFKREIWGLSNDIDTLIALVDTGIQWLIFGLVLHLFFRGIWIGLVGLSYVFPKGINQERLDYQPQFEKRLTLIPQFTNQIVKLEKISSSIFSISYFIFMSLLGVYFFLFVSILIPFYLFLFFAGVSFADLNDNPQLTQALNLYAIGMMVIGLIYMLDFLSLGLLKKNKYVAKIYYPIYKVMSVLTFSSVYRSIYYILISNFKKWKVVSFILAFIVITVFLFSQNSNPNSTSRNFSRLEFYGGSRGLYVPSQSYLNSSTDARFQRAAIQSDIVKDDVLRLFITHQVAYEDSIRSLCDYQQLQNRYSQDSLKLVCMNEFYHVSINDSTYRSPKWYFYHDPKSDHRGIIAYFNISHLGTGMHELEVSLENWFFENFATIPFYKE